MSRPVWGGFCHPPLCVVLVFGKGGGGEEGGERGAAGAEDETVVLGGDSCKSGGCLAPDGGEDARSRSRSFCCCLRTACGLAGIVRLFFPLTSLANCRLCFPASSSAALPPSCSPSLLLPFPLPSFLVTPGGEEGGCPLARTAGCLPPASVLLGSLPPCRDLGGNKIATELRGCTPTPPFRVAIFLGRAECFDVPFPLRFMGARVSLLGAGMLDTLKIILSWLQSRESGALSRAHSASLGARLTAGQ